MKSKLSGKMLTVKVCDKEIQIPAQRGKAIKAYCTDCSVGQVAEVRNCPCTMCPLYAFRGYMRWDNADSDEIEALEGTSEDDLALSDQETVQFIN
jgi:hypothetical protein